MELPLKRTRTSTFRRTDASSPAIMESIDNPSLLGHSRLMQVPYVEGNKSLGSLPPDVTLTTEFTSLKLNTRFDEANGGSFLLLDGKENLKVLQEEHHSFMEGNTSDYMRFLLYQTLSYIGHDLNVCIMTCSHSWGQLHVLIHNISKEPYKQWGSAVNLVDLYLLWDLQLSYSMKQDTHAHYKPHIHGINVALTESAEDFLRNRFAQSKLEIEAFSSLRYVGIQTLAPPTDFADLRAAVQSELENTTVRSARQPNVVYHTLKLLNDKFSGEIENVSPVLFPDQYFTCPVKCLSCERRCESSMGHLKEGMPHSCAYRCRYQHQFENCTYICKLCHSNGKEVVVSPKLTSSSDTSWLGLAKYAWSGYVIECPHCGEIYRSRQYWYGNKNPEDAAVRTEIQHVWPGVPPGASSVAAVVRNGSSYSFSRHRIAPIEIHRQLCQVYGPNIMSKQMVRRWCRQFSEGRQSVHDEERSGLPSLINDDCVELVRQCIMENRRFTITELSSHFPQIRVSRSLLHEIVTKHLLFKKVCQSNSATLGSQNAAQKVLDGVTYISEAVASVGSPPTRMLSSWVADQIAPKYWRPNHEIKLCIIFIAASMNDNLIVDDVDDTEVRARKYGEAVVSTLSTVASVLEYPRGLIKDTARPLYWVPDHEVTHCCCCEVQFSARITLHHCRDCGRGVCKECSMNRRAVPLRGWDNPVRICDQCMKKD
ncbi:hypothetical protein ANN_06915 [Periplaneta americana]|uniref:FYVE-type domain-containing protein n=1 Tax=Periplaneta americana TaxID=6978 RepID=A0ABQ8TG74_PERAM|nr:hypothetical protein ANN_06915 [Periplaneta americana]